MKTEMRSDKARRARIMMRFKTAMHQRFFLPCFTAGLFLAAFSNDILRGRDVRATDADEGRLLKAALPIDSSGLVQFFHQRMRGEPAQGTLSQLVETLRTKSAARRQACAELIAIGAPAAPFLRSASHGDLVSDDLVQHCLKAIEIDGSGLTAAAARLLGLRDPSSAAGVLLAYLPHAENEWVRKEIQKVLNALASDKRGLSDRSLFAALSDSSPLRRIAAFTALAQDGLSKRQEALRKVLRDSSLPVRLHAAWILARRNESEAVTTLIDLLGEVSDPFEREKIEDFLLELAGEAGPNVPLGEDLAGCRRTRDAWARWWRGVDGAAVRDGLKKQRSAAADTVRRTRLRGYMLIVQGKAGTVAEWGPDGKLRWKLSGLNEPRDAQMLSGRRVLVVEKDKVTERSLGGKVLWQTDAVETGTGEICSAQRLPNGNTLFVHWDSVIEVDRDGVELMHRRLIDGGRPHYMIRKLPDGGIFIVSGRTLIQLDSSGYESKIARDIIDKHHPAGGRDGDPFGPAYPDILDDGRFLSPASFLGRLYEYDADGKALHCFRTLHLVRHAFRLPNGHTLVTIEKKQAKVGFLVELDEKWRVLKETALPTLADLVKRR